MSGYYGVRRSFLSDPDFHNAKQLASDACTSSGAKPFGCESAAGQGHAALLDAYFPEPCGDHRPTALTPSSGTLFSASPLPPLLPPPFPSDPAHFMLVSTQRLRLGGHQGRGSRGPGQPVRPAAKGLLAPGEAGTHAQRALLGGSVPATRQEALSMQGSGRDDRIGRDCTLRVPPDVPRCSPALGERALTDLADPAKPSRGGASGRLSPSPSFLPPPRYFSPLEPSPLAVLPEMSL